MQVTAFSACTCMKFNDIGYRGDQIIGLNGPLWSYFIISCCAKQISEGVATGEHLLKLIFFVN